MTAGVPRRSRRGGRARHPSNRAAAIITALTLAACGQRAATPAPPAPTPTVAAPVAAVPPQAGPTTASTPHAVAALPRALGDIPLGASRGEVEQHLGQLSCHTNDEGLDVCHPGDGGQPLEIFFHRSVVVSLAQQVPGTGDVWTQLETLMGQYGNPSLNGLREHDRDGRLHEVYGWKDDDTLYSIRFVWKEDGDQGRQLIGTTVTLWDRQGYAEWEQDPSHRPPPAAPAPPEATPEAA